LTLSHDDRLIHPTVASRSRSLRICIGGAEFGILLRGLPALGDASFESAISRARRFRGGDEEGYRAEFISLVERASHLRRDQSPRESDVVSSAV